jgi:branched-chain amino acid transport system substrate-binding protein
MVTNLTKERGQNMNFLRSKKHSRGTKFILLVAAVALLFSLAVGCAPKAPAVQPIVIGAPCNLGQISKNLYNGALLAAEEINAKGGVTVGGMNRPLKIVTADTRDLEPGIPIQDVVLAYKDLISKEKPVALVGGPIRSEAVAAVMENIAADKVIHIFCGSVSSLFMNTYKQDPAKYKYLFKNSPTEIDLVGVLLGAMAAVKSEFGFNSVFFFVEDVDFARRAQPQIAALLKGQGWDVTPGSVNTPLGLTDYSSALLKFKDSGAKVGFYIYSSEAAPLAKQLQAMQLPVMMVGVCDPLGGPGAWEATQGAVKGWVNYICGAGNMAVSKMPKTVEFVNSYTKKFKEPPQIVLGCSQSYDGVYLIVDAINRAGSLDPDQLVTALEAANYAGVVGLTKFPADKHQAPYSMDPATGLIGVAFQWWDKNRVPVFPASVAEGKIYKPF